MENLSTPEKWAELYNNFQSPICQQCGELLFSKNRVLSKPEPIPYIGPNFYTDDYRLMFIGIETYSGIQRNTYNNTELYPFETKDIKDRFFNDKKPYWKWINLISTEILSAEKKPEEAFPRIAYSNIHKCQSARIGVTKGSRDNPSYEILEEKTKHCVNLARWVHREIEIIKPKNVVVFAGSRTFNGESNYIAKQFLEDPEGKLLRKFYDDYKVPMENYPKSKDSYYLAHFQDGERRFIVTNHPRNSPIEIRSKIIELLKNDAAEIKNCPLPRFNPDILK